jgi:hypothetical protein
MEKRDLRIAKTIREDLHNASPLFVTTYDLKALYKEAADFCYFYNEMIKKGQRKIPAIYHLEKFMPRPCFIFFISRCSVSTSKTKTLIIFQGL